MMKDIDRAISNALAAEAESFVPTDLGAAEQRFVGRRRRRRFTWFGGATLATAAAVIAVAVFPRPDLANDRQLRPAGLAIQQRIDVPAEPLAIAAGPLGVWVASRTAGRVTLVNEGGETVRSLGLPGANEIVAGAANAWAAGLAGHVIRIDQVSLEQTGEIFNNVSTTVVDMAVGGTSDGAAWSVDAAGCVMDLTDPGPDFDCRAPEELQATDVATDEDETWLLSGERGELHQLKADVGVNEGRAIGTGPVPLPATPRGEYADLLVAGDAIWVTGESGQMMRLDLQNGERAYTEIGGDYADLAAGPDTIWALVGTEGSDVGSVVQIDVATGEPMGEPFRLGGKPSDIAVLGDDIWITLRESDEVVRIGR